MLRRHQCGQWAHIAGDAAAVVTPREGMGDGRPIAGLTLGTAKQVQRDRTGIEALHEH